MGNRKARDFQREEELRITWERAIGVPRAINQDLLVHGFGARRLQVLVAPSFEPGVVWEIRGQKSDFTLYRSLLHSRSPEFIAFGYEKMEISSDELKHHLDIVYSFEIPIHPFLTNLAGRDGTYYRLSIFGDLHSEMHLQWWSDSPPAWKEIVAEVDRMQVAFGGLKPA